MIVWREKLAPVEVLRDNQGRVVPVYADVASGGLDAAVAAIESALVGLELPPRMRQEVGGVNEEMRESLEAGGVFPSTMLDRLVGQIRALD